MANVAFGRKIKLTIYSPDTEETQAIVIESDLMAGKRGFKVTGTVNQYFAVQPPDATIDIYNLSATEVANILAIRTKQVGSQFVQRPIKIRIEAGYNRGSFGVIFDGEILKPNMVKPDPNNTILRLTCIDGAEFMSASSVLTQTFNDGINYYSVAQQVTANTKLNVYVTEELKNYKVDGSFVTKVTNFQTLSEIANDTNTVFSYYDGKAYLRTYSDLGKIMSEKQNAYVLNYKTGLIGFPALSNNEITVQSVLNPNLKPMGLIQLNNADISINQPEYLADRQIGAWLSSDGLYLISQVIHNFDTTTGAFTTNCKCLARDYLNYLQ